MKTSIIAWKNVKKKQPSQRSYWEGGDSLLNRFMLARSFDVLACETPHARWARTRAVYDSFLSAIATRILEPGIS